MITVETLQTVMTNFQAQVHQNIVTLAQQHMDAMKDVVNSNTRGPFERRYDGHEGHWAGSGVQGRRPAVRRVEGQAVRVPPRFHAAGHGVEIVGATENFR